MKIILSTILLASSSLVFPQKCSNCQDLYDKENYDIVVEKLSENSEKRDFDELVLLAKSYQKLNKKKEAIRVYNIILTEDENNIEALVAVGALFVEMGDLENALFATERALKYDPTNHKALYNMAIILFKQKDVTRLNDFLDEQIKVDVYNLDFLYVKSLFYLESEDFENACKWFQKIEKINAKYSNYSLYYGYSLFKLKKFDLANEKLTFSASLKDEQEIDSYYYLALVNRELNNKVDACESYTAAINLGDLTLTKEADAFCGAKENKNFKIKERGIRLSF